jgi:uncharacterized protein (TIGR03435 family)
MRRGWAVGMLVAVLLVLGGWGVARAQAGGGAARFEVASVRLSAAGGDGMSSMHLNDGPRVSMRNVPLFFLVQFAFGVEDYQITGEPKWMESTLYDVEAKPEGDAVLTSEQLKPLLQQLLVERFHLTVHREMKDFKGYGLVAAKGGAKLQGTKGGGIQAQILPNGLRATKMDTKHLASILAHVTGRPVVDRTGIAGDYDIKVEYAGNGAGGGMGDSSLPSIFTALQEQLGLRLEAQTVPVEMLVVDKVERVPVEN